MERLLRVTLKSIAMAVISLVVLCGADALPSGATGTSATPAQIAQTQTWVTQIKSDYGSLDGVVLAMLEAFESWQTHSLSAKSVTTSIETNLGAVEQTVDALNKQAPLPWSGQALRQYQAAAELYLEAFQVERVASVSRVGALQRQLQNSEARLRELGDRTYSLATNNLASYLPVPAKDPYVTTIQSSPVPNWAKEGLFPGSPLDSGRPPKSNPRVGGSSWARVISRISIPSAHDEASAIRTRSAKALRELSDSYYVTAEELAKAPRPPGGVTELDGLRLSLLADSEAMRVSEAARFTKTPSETSDLRSSAEQLATLSRLIWNSSTSAG
jgi:hypothetical protein